MKNRILLFVLTALLAINASAQEKAPYPHAFISAQGGVMRAYNGGGIDRKWNPMAAVSVGYNFSSVFGLRLQANGSTWKATLPDDSKYKSKIGNIDLDMLFNLSNIFFPRQNNHLNLIAVAGTPINMAIPHAWIDNVAYATATGSDRWNTAWKVGGMIDYSLSKHWSVNLEAGTNYVHQKNDANIDNNKWWPYAMAGLTFKFGHRKAKKMESEPEPVIEQQPVRTVEATPVIQTTPEPVPVPVEPTAVTKPVKITENIFFSISKSYIKAEQAAKLEDIVTWANEHPESTFTLTGYADRNTGTHKYNQMIADRRAQAIKKALIEKGIAAERLSVEVKGDSEQPFANNNDNRVVIIVGDK